MYHVVGKMSYWQDVWVAARQVAVSGYFLGWGVFIGGAKGPSASQERELEHSRSSAYSEQRTAPNTRTVATGNTPVVLQEMHAQHQIESPVCAKEAGQQAAGVGSASAFDSV